MVAMMRTALAGVLALSLLVIGDGATGAERDRNQREADAFRFEALAPIAMAQGQCGLFVWSKEEQPQLIIVAFDNPAEARVRVSRRDRTLRRTDFDGDRVYGHFGQQTFSDGRTTITLDVTLAENGMRDGAVIERGVVRVNQDRGWQTIIPVGGLVACQR